MEWSDCSTAIFGKVGESIAVIERPWPAQFPGATVWLAHAMYYVGLLSAVPSKKEAAA